MANQEITTRLVDLRPDLPKEQSATASPISISRELPAMALVGKEQSIPLQKSGLLMGAGEGAAAHARMSEVPQERKTVQPAQHAPQIAREAPVFAASDGYLRLEMHSENGRLSIIGAKTVPGPVAFDNTVARGHVYEALIDGRRIALGSIPDAGLRRAFANRDVPGPEGKHRFIPQPSFDFFIRIPNGEIAAAALPKLNVVLYQVKEAPERLTNLETLQKHPGVEATEVARLTGMHLQELPAVVRPHIDSILKEREILK